MKNHYYSQHAGPLRAELGAAISRDQMRDLHRKQPARHLIVAARQFAILAAATWGLIRFEHPLIWMPLAVVQGFTVFNFTVLLHEVVHHTIFERRRPALERMLGFLYAIPSGISASQFTRWHLDHHAELGSDEDDPKRHHLSPKIAQIAARAARCAAIDTRRSRAMRACSAGGYVALSLRAARK